MTTPVIIDAYLDELLGDSAQLEPAPTVVALVPPVAVAATEPSSVPVVSGESVPGVDDVPTAASTVVEDTSSRDTTTAGTQPPSTSESGCAATPVAATVLPFAPRPAASVAAEPAPRTAPAMASRSQAGTRSARPGRWLRVCIADDRYAVELLRVQEVVRVTPFVAMRGAEPWVLGVMNLRGRIVPVIDLGVWLDAGHVIPEERSRIVVVERNDELIGLLVTAVNDVATLDATHIEPPLSAGDPGPIVGVARAGDAPTVLLDANALFG